MQKEAALFIGNQFHIGRGQINCRRNDGQVVNIARLNNLVQSHVIKQKLVGRQIPIFGNDSKPGRGIALRVQIHDEHLVTEFCKRRGQVDRSCRFADATLLVGNSNDFRTGRARGIRHGKSLLVPE